MDLKLWTGKDILANKLLGMMVRLHQDPFFLFWSTFSVLYSQVDNILRIDENLTNNISECSNFIFILYGLVELGQDETGKVQMWDWILRQDWILRHEGLQPSFASFWELSDMKFWEGSMRKLPKASFLVVLGWALVQSCTNVGLGSIMIS